MWNFPGVLKTAQEARGQDQAFAGGRGALTHGQSCDDPHLDTAHAARAPHGAQEETGRENGGSRSLGAPHGHARPQAQTAGTQKL